MKKRTIYRLMSGIFASSLLLSGCQLNNELPQETIIEAETSEIVINLETTEENVETLEETTEGTEETENAEETENTDILETSGVYSADDLEIPGGIPEGYKRSVQIIKSDKRVNIRKGPGTDFESVATLEEGTEIQKVSEGAVWIQVIYQGQVLYASKQYFSLVEDHAVISDITINADESVTPSDAQSETPAEAPAEAPTEAPTAASTEPQTQPTTAVSVSTDQSDLSAISNDVIPYGYGQGRDDKNRPTGVLYYENLYGKYPADFIAPDTNTVYLTMDEGYEAGYTPAILDTLKEKNVKALFFVTKQFVTEHPELVQRMIAEGHQIGNHTCAHPAAGMPTLGLEAEEADIMWLHNYVKDNFGYTMTLFRYPSGLFSEQSLALLGKLGYHAVFWSFAHKDWDTNNQPEESSALQKCLDEGHNGAIYLLHAVSKTNTDNMAAFIDGMRAKGFEFGVYPSQGF